jgi:hypothetical protein
MMQSEEPEASSVKPSHSDQVETDLRKPVKPQPKRSIVKSRKDIPQETLVKSVSKHLSNNDIANHRPETPIKDIAPP